MPDTNTAALPNTASSESLSNFDSFRETIESIAVAFMLAFIFKTFLVEAFVIPTGSMAPTLMGQHYDITCPQCQHQYRFGYRGVPQANATCPNCEYTIPDVGKNHPLYSGDRILVNKFLYDFDPPQRWDVIVFKYPEDAKTNYIKRLIGLPGEQLAIRNGDIFTTPLVNNQPQGQEEIARKPNHRKLQAMLQQVYNNDDLFDGFIKRGWPLRWQDWSPPSQPAVWQTEKEGRKFSVPQATTENAWLRYQHFSPYQNDWQQYYQRPREKFENIKPRVIVDEYAYNNDSQSNDWVGDIAVEAEIATLDDGGEVTLELIKGGKAFYAILDLKAGTARLEIPDLPDFKPEPVKIGWSGAGKHKVLFANVDRQLWLIIDGESIFDTAASVYPDLNNNMPVEVVLQRGQNIPSDFSPVGIAVRGAAASVDHLRILRDVYYINHEEHRRTHSEFVEQHSLQGPIRLLDSPDDDDKDQFFMLGDNSPSSSDSRYWRKQNFVERRQLIGKAIYVFWPHAWDFDWSFEVPLGSLSFKFPFYPNFKRMTLIR